MTPFLLAAFANAPSAGAPAELAALAADAARRRSDRRLAAWDYSTPTGIPEGYDASDRTACGSRRSPPAEVAAPASPRRSTTSGAAKLIRSVIDARLAALGVPGVGSGDALKAVHHLLAAAPFTGVGASGVDFFAEPAAPRRRSSAATSRCSPRCASALDALASPTFARAFAHLDEPGRLPLGQAAPDDLRSRARRRLLAPAVRGLQRSLAGAAGPLARRRLRGRERVGLSARAPTRVDALPLRRRAGAPLRRRRASRCGHRRHERGARRAVGRSRAIRATRRSSASGSPRTPTGSTCAPRSRRATSRRGTCSFRRRRRELAFDAEQLRVLGVGAQRALDARARELGPAARELGAGEACSRRGLPAPRPAAARRAEHSRRRTGRPPA